MAAKKYAQADKSRCVACGACLRGCRLQAISIVKGCYASMDAARCVGCGKCAALCPAGCIALREKEAAV